MSRTALRAGAAAAATCAVVLVAVALTAGDDDPGDAGAVDCGTFAFDGAQWRAARSRSEDGDPGRLLAAARGLQECGALDGRPATAVRRMLGPPALTLAGGRLWSYSLGEHGGSDPTWLSVSFDRRRAVRAVRIADPAEG